MSSYLARLLVTRFHDEMILVVRPREPFDRGKWHKFPFQSNAYGIGRC